MGKIESVAVNLIPPPALFAIINVLFLSGEICQLPSMGFSNVKPRCNVKLPSFDNFNATAFFPKPFSLGGLF